MSDIYRLSWQQMLRELEAGHISSRQIVESLLARADEVNDSVNALIHRFDERALAAADSADDARAKGVNYGPLHGLPVTIKESLSTRGVPVTLGVRSRQIEVAEDDAVLVQALCRNGAIVLGKTNVSQTLLFNESDNPIWGPTKNPWNAERVPGGSSGGEAAAVAAGISAMGMGTDIGGSIRVPAAYCGVAGLKPTVGRWSMKGSVGSIAGQESIKSQSGPIARTARDLALVMRGADSVAHHALDPYVPPVPMADPERVDPKTLRVGYYETDGFLTPAAPVQRAVREAADAMRAAGATVLRFEPPRSVELTFSYFATLSADGGKTLEAFLRGDEVAPQLNLLRTVARLPGPIREIAAAFMASKGEVRVEKLLKVVHEKPLKDFWALAHTRQQYQQEVLQAWDQMQLDVVLCPPHATAALKHGQSKDFSLGGCYAMRYNSLNFPGGVVPVSRVQKGETERPYLNDRLDRTAAEAEANSEGLPLAVQVVARPYREDLCLAAMIAIEDQVRAGAHFPLTPVDPS